LTDPEYRDHERKKHTAAARVARLCGAVGYSLGDENYLSTGEEYCWSDTCQAYFRDYLKRTYETLDTLNREWASTYGDWAEIVPITLQQAREDRSEGAFAERADHRLAMEELWADIHRFCRGAIRRPAARRVRAASHAEPPRSVACWFRGV